MISFRMPTVIDPNSSIWETLIPKLSVPTRCYCIHPEILPTSRQLHPTDPPDPTPPDQSQTWMFRTGELLDLLQLAWSDLKPENKDLDHKLELLPRVWDLEGLPHPDKSGTQSSIAAVP